MKLNNTLIKNLKPSTKDRYLSDGFNLYLLVKPNSSKLWRFIYVSPETGLRVKMSLGSYPHKSLAEAREEARNHHKILSQGFCPKSFLIKQAEIKKEQSETLRDFAYKWIEWKQAKANQNKPLSPKTIKRTMQRLENHLFPRFKNMRLIDVRLKDAITRLEDLENKKPDTLYRIVGNFIEIMDYAQLLEKIPDNPIKPLKKAFSSAKVTHQPTIPPEQLPEFLKALQKSSRSPQTKLLIEWQLVTMLRPFEASAVEWTDIDFKNKVLTIPAERMKGGMRSHSIPLSTQALAILEEMKAFNGHHVHVFTGRNERHKPANSQTVNNAVKRIAKGKYKGLLTAHGFRSIASTYLNENFTDEPLVIESCLSHVGTDAVRNAYFRGSYLDRRVAIMQAWGDYVEQCKKA